MPWIWMVVLFALCIPLVGLLVDSPIGRALGVRLERHQRVDPASAEAVAALTSQLQVLEGEVDALRQELRQVREEQEFTQRLLHAPRPPTSLPPSAE